MGPIGRATRPNPRVGHAAAGRGTARRDSSVFCVSARTPGQGAAGQGAAARRESPPASSQRRGPPRSGARACKADRLALGRLEAPKPRPPSSPRCAVAHPGGAARSSPTPPGLLGRPRPHGDPCKPTRGLCVSIVSSRPRRRPPPRGEACHSRERALPRSRRCSFRTRRVGSTDPMCGSDCAPFGANVSDRSPFNEDRPPRLRTPLVSAWADGSPASGPSADDLSVFVRPPANPCGSGAQTAEGFRRER